MVRTAGDKSNLKVSKHNEVSNNVSSLLQTEQARNLKHAFKCDAVYFPRYIAFRVYFGKTFKAFHFTF